MRTENFLEHAVFEFEHDVGIHLDEAAIAVVRKARVAGELGQAFDGLVVETEVQHRIHHTRHRRARAGAHGDEQRIGGIAEAFAGFLLECGERCIDLSVKFRRVSAIVLVELGADFGGEREARRHRQIKPRHLREIGALAAKQRLHRSIAPALAAAKPVDVLLRSHSLALHAPSRSGGAVEREA